MRIVLNGEFAFDGTDLRDGDRVEVIGFIGGGQEIGT